MAIQATPTQADNVYEHLRADILSCRLRPGAKIRINEVARGLGVSLGAVREALSRLSAEDMAVSTAQKGYSVPEVSVEDLQDLTNTRIQIEELCMRASMQNGDIEWETALVGSFHRLQRIPEVVPGETPLLNESWSGAHQQFHQAIVAACKSPSLLKIRAVLYAQTERYRRLSVPIRITNRDVAAEHKAIFDAVISRDADLASALMEKHLRLTTEIIVKALSHDSENLRKRLNTFTERANARAST